MNANHEAQGSPDTIDSLGLPADIMVTELSRLLATPGFLGQSVATLRRADGAFNVLDELMRNGDPLPRRWSVKGRPERHGPVTELYDSVSETLREVGGAAQSFMALRRAAADWRALDAALRSGWPLPEPWQR
ncbi:hypothetical protein NE857_33505 [Nocardiopsis exhalans]|uniref:Uncharacterized protein n=1 Tax=Nocardiopsis exhalans TaxID=163604 RepID=A0ABY5D6W3_9ACTN|nr:hypothetical protein [Nocardiopsis exhalans]USY20084.1 hypothetical protein NE857_33505 [Nocardiopsis exhalans]